MPGSPAWSVCRGAATQTAVSNAGAGDIARVHGLRASGLATIVGAVPGQRRGRRFPTPTLESIIRPPEPRPTGRMFARRCGSSASKTR